MTTLHEIAAKLAGANDAVSANSSSAVESAAVAPAFGLAPNPVPTPATPANPATPGRKGKGKPGQSPAPMKPVTDAERREHRRHDLDHQAIMVDRWDGARRAGQPFGRIVDISAGGIRVRTDSAQNIRPDNQIRVRLELPDYAGISPFIDHQMADSATPRAKREWVGWMAVTRVKPVAGTVTDVAGRLVDMDEMDRGMLGLYLSTQPLAA
jgi:hypothetical protein